MAEREHDADVRPVVAAVPCGVHPGRRDRVVAEVPALQLADFGVDVPEALDRLQAMVSFHLDCLVQEGKPIPVERREDAGFYLRVKPPPHAA